MEVRIWLITIVGLLSFVLLLWGVERMIHAAASSRNRSDQAKVRRRSTAGAAFALQQVFEPGVEHVVRTEQDQPDEDDDSAGEGSRETLIDTHLADLMASLGRSPVSSEEVRRILTSAQRQDLDWRSLFQTAIDLELEARPFRAPFLPSVARVAPRSDS